MKTFRFVVRYPIIHRVIHRLFPRPYVYYGMPLVSCPMCAYVWREMEKDPAFVAGIEQGRRDFEEGRTTLYRVVDGELELVP